MSYSSFLHPRPEVLSEDLEGIIDLANLKDETKTRLEARPKDFLDLTYPTSDVAKVIEQINLRFSSSKQSSGLFLFEGLKGSGKSHLLLMIHHLLQSPEISQDWLFQNGFKIKLPKDLMVLINKFTDDPYDSLWDMIFQALGYQPPKRKTQPTLSEFQKALGDKKIVLIFDELEQGIKVISDTALQAQNIAFLQMLSELSNRSKQVTLFASIYSERDEPGSTFKRVNPRCTVQFDSTKDQGNIILHRLFSNFRQFDKSRISPIIESYFQLWQKEISLDKEEVKKRWDETYPFSPSLLNIILKEVPARGGFQNVRGALAFLGNLVRLTHAQNDLITPADVSLNDRASTIMLRDLDPGGGLINRAKENMSELTSKAPLAEKIAPAVLLYTLTGRGSNVGATREQLLLDILSPVHDINSFEQSLMVFQKYASYFWHQESRYFFDLEENPEAKIEFNSIKYSDDQARELIEELFKGDIFRETENVAVFNSIDQTQELLKQFEKNRPRYVFTGRRLTQEERHNIYFGMDQRNLILLLEPRDDLFQLPNDKDLLKWAKRILAAKDLAKSPIKTSRQAEYNRIASEDKKFIVEKIRKANLVFVSWEIFGESVTDDRIELEPLPGDLSKDKVLEKLNQEYFPVNRFREHLEGRLKGILNRSVKEVDNEYRSTLTFPVPANIRAVSSAIRELCKDAVIGIQHKDGSFCRQNPGLSETEIFNAKIIDPFDSPPPSPPPVCPKCGQRPCQCSQEPCPVCNQWPCQCRPPVEVCPVCNQAPCVCKSRAEVHLKVPPQTSLGGLRQEVAFRLQEYENGYITKATYQIYYQKRDIGDLSTLPASLRGSLNGQGELTAEISILKIGKFAKVQIEQQIESLPQFSGAEYSTELVVIVEK
jgi:hypothetical protein